MKEVVAISPRLEEYYRIFSEAEKREFRRFLLSPYFNRQEELIKLHDYFSNGVDALTKAHAWQAVFGKRGYEEKKFRYMVSDLINAAEEFVYYESIRQNRPAYISSVNDFYTSREATLNKTSLEGHLKKPQRVRLLNSSLYLEKHFESELLEEIHTESRKEYSRYITETRTGRAGGLDAFYVIEKLRQMCQVANDNNVFGLQLSVFFEKEIKQIARLQELKSNPLVLAYSAVCEMLRTQAGESYHQLKETIGEYGYEIDRYNMAELFTYARNFCIARVNSGKTTFFKELFDLYEQGLEQGILLVNGEINQQNYKNIVTTALRTGQYEWAEDFIQEYRYRLNKTVRDNAFNYNMANYLFHAKRFDKVPQYLQKVQLSDLFYGLDARSLMIKCFYETDEREAFMNAYQSFRVFVQRKKNVSTQHRRNYLNFLALAKKLMNLQARNKKAIEKLNYEIENAKAIADKTWLQEKIKVFTA